MATCVNCHASSRDSAQTFTVEPVTRVVREIPPMTPDQKIEQLTFEVEECYRLTHVQCGWYIDGRIEGDYFIAERGAS